MKNQEKWIIETPIGIKVYNLSKIQRCDRCGCVVPYEATDIEFPDINEFSPMLSKQAPPLQRERHGQRMRDQKSL